MTVPGSAAYIDWAAAVSLGADFIDLNGDGQYDPYVDRPALLGDKTVWTVFNDGTPMSQRMPRLGTPPIGLEILQTAWAFDRGGALNDIIFFRFQIINTSQFNVQDLIFSVWGDPDLGDYTDDLVGCDTLLDIGYCYNDGFDTQYGIDPPAFGVSLLQGALVDSPGDTAFVFRGALAGVDTLLDMKNLPWTSFTYYISSNPLIGDPTNVREARNYQIGGLDRFGNPINPAQWGIGEPPRPIPCIFTAVIR